ncbi:hypothetical protein SORBI_3002G115050 [Sorghum bicolor]|uniref:Uncharacterized protein n=1 Tax=Sorghum bicolor TaxID=4558 RepID=A0A1W0W3E3_SORBI|nr:hypothetical protein SORBI_3002G115050 [Sorghum bicolor]
MIFCLLNGWQSISCCFGMHTSEFSFTPLGYSSETISFYASTFFASFLIFCIHHTRRFIRIGKTGNQPKKRKNAARK